MINLKELEAAGDRFAANLPKIFQMAEERGDTDFQYFKDVAELLAAAKFILDAGDIRPDPPQDMALNEKNAWKEGWLEGYISQMKIDEDS